ncbi:hypothetical protein [Streptomyces sp. NRRL S-646]|uniref:hypothetical protein n=1 Tax=Streptomyces sp. NRRL S-646 TaxID=1463917 RepID=UPI0004CA054C|nr:hypothetical protein [Streptomyces sp. NRRL S-646]
MVDEYDELLPKISAHNEACRVWHGSRLAAAEERNNALEEIQWRAVQAAYDEGEPQRATAFMRQIAEQRAELNELWTALDKQAWEKFYCD